MPQFSLCKKLNLLNSLCFPCLEKLTAKFPVFPVPWPPCIIYYHVQVIRTIRNKNRIFPQIASSSATTPHTALRLCQHVILTHKIIIITALFFICWIPFQVMITVFTACPHDFPSNDEVHCGISGNSFTVSSIRLSIYSILELYSTRYCRDAHL